MIDERGDVLRVCDDPSARKWAFALGVGGTVIVGWFFLVVALAGDDRGQIRPAVAVGAYCAAIAVAVGVFWNFTGGPLCRHRLRPRHGRVSRAVLDAQGLAGELHRTARKYRVVTDLLPRDPDRDEENYQT